MWCQRRKRQLSCGKPGLDITALPKDAFGSALPRTASRDEPTQVSWLLCRGRGLKSSEKRVRWETLLACQNEAD